MPPKVLKRPMQHAHHRSQKRISDDSPIEVPNSESEIEQHTRYPGMVRTISDSLFIIENVLNSVATILQVHLHAGFQATQPLQPVPGVPFDIRSISTLVSAFTAAFHQIDVAAHLQRAAASSH